MCATIRRFPDRRPVRPSSSSLSRQVNSRAPPHAFFTPLEVIAIVAMLVNRASVVCAASLALAAMLFCANDSNASDLKRFGTTRDAWDKNNDVRSAGKHGDVKVKADSSTLVHLLPATRQLIWYCGGTRESCAKNNPSPWCCLNGRATALSSGPSTSARNNGQPDPRRNYARRLRQEER